jgi:aminopeptidase N
LVKVRELLVHKSFRISNPNNVYALIGGFCGGNLLHFHAKDGSGYKFLTEQILALDAINPQVAARMLVPFTKLANYALARQRMILENLQQLAEYKQLSKNTAEIVHKSLG